MERVEIAGEAVDECGLRQSRPHHGSVRRAIGYLNDWHRPAGRWPAETAIAATEHRHDLARLERAGGHLVEIAADAQQCAASLSLVYDLVDRVPRDEARLRG